MLGRMFRRYVRGDCDGRSRSHVMRQSFSRYVWCWMVWRMNDPSWLTKVSSGIVLCPAGYYYCTDDCQGPPQRSIPY